MANICEHEFDNVSKTNPKYSSLEYDLYSKLQMAIRKNLISRDFEIFSLKDGRVLYHGYLTAMVKKANELERAENTIVKCGSLCPLLKQDRRRVV